VTTDLLRRIIAILPTAQPLDTLLYECAFSLAVYGMLRVSEFTCPKTGSFDASLQANLQDLKVYRASNGHDYATLLIRAAKADVFRNTSMITIHATGQSDCPVRIIERYLATRQHSGPGTPLFVLENGNYLTRGRVSVTLRTALRKLGMAEECYAPHSFRIGATVSLAAAGVPGYVIAILGRWSSDCYLLYLKLTPKMLGDVYKKMGAISAQDVQSRGAAGKR